MLKREFWIHAQTISHPIGRQLSRQVSIKGLNRPDPVIQPAVERHDQSQNEKEVGRYGVPEIVDKEERDYCGHSGGDDGGRKKQCYGRCRHDDFESLPA